MCGGLGGSGPGPGNKESQVLREPEARRKLKLSTFAVSTESIYIQTTKRAVVKWNIIISSTFLIFTSTQSGLPNAVLKLSGPKRQ